MFAELDESNADDDLAAVALPDFDEPSDTDSTAFADNDFGTASDITAASSAMDFSDLYDKETMAGKHSTMYDDEETDETVKKTRVPVTICVICAIICIIATLLVLFVIPSKYNWKNWSKHNRNADGEWVMPVKEIPLDITPVPQDPVDDSDWAVPSPIVPEAEEDKIVVAPQPELVVPAPKPAEKPKTTGDIRYRIKWGDTLWDISEAYYKNPWRYPRIARYNNIKNPDLIISGTDILIPEE
ncbi:MAG: LysM peptidoglycan-binding domain-containing protein [Treponemataceae bacterium]|nr:LysM peptidoglycan-binding domain-containing protein [Treponemataceae bacterium]